MLPMKLSFLVLIPAILFLIMPDHCSAGVQGLNLEEGQLISGFSVLNLYENGAGNVIGVRFKSMKYGFILDLLFIEAVPQAYIWVKTPVKNEKGLPHIAEHLLLARGSKGRYTAMQRWMSVSQCGAWSHTTETSYTFSTASGIETFYDFFHSHLDALLNPDLSEEEISREAFHLEVSVNSQDGSYSLEEAGTIHNETMSYYDQPFDYIWWPMNRMLYGEAHPLALDYGGNPEHVRTFKPADFWIFHKNHYHLSNMGAMVSIPPTLDVPTFLGRLETILGKCQSFQNTSPFVGISALNLPASKSARPYGQLKIVDYPSDNAAAPGQIKYSWPPVLKCNTTELILLDLFLATLANGTSSNLYSLLIDSKTRKLDSGTKSVTGFVYHQQGFPIQFHFQGVHNSHLNQAQVMNIRDIIIEEIRRIYNYKDHSEKIVNFNTRAKSWLVKLKKEYNDLLNSPPMFSYLNDTALAWLSHMKLLEAEPGFRKSLLLQDHLKLIAKQLDENKNVWKNFIDQWKLLTVPPYAVAIKPSSQLLHQMKIERNSRINQYEQMLMKLYDSTTVQEALQAFKREYDRQTLELEKRAEQDRLPTFTENPPLTFDDQLIYEVIQLQGGIELIASTFENMISSTIGIALRLDVIPENLLVYVPILPEILTEIGVTKNGEIIESDKMKDRLRQEILSLRAYIDYDLNTERSELVLKGRASDSEELEKVRAWFDACLFSPLLRMENIPRIIDIIDQQVESLRKKINDEYAFHVLAFTYLYQTNPLLMSSSCFLTQIHHFQRLKWLLTDPGNEEEQRELDLFLAKLSQLGHKNRAEIRQALEARTEVSSSNRNLTVYTAIIESLKTTLPEIPDANLAQDWIYLCHEIRQDLITPPEQAISDLKRILTLLNNSDNARMFMISNSRDRSSFLKKHTSLSNHLATNRVSLRQDYSTSERILAALKSRVGEIPKPIYVGLVNETRRNGDMISIAKRTKSFPTGEKAILDYLTIKLCSGGGAHTLYMKTWEAGLTYSSGINYSDVKGMVTYSANRCPNVADTMRFVVNTVENMKHDPALLEYALAQTFMFSRANQNYEQRGEAMASDLTDGVTPARVRSFRTAILNTSKTKDLYLTIKSRMENVYGSVLIGYGPSLSKNEEGIFFLLGPESQFQALEQFIQVHEDQCPVYKLYPCDFWIRLALKK
ncbi:hypothetical protein ACFL27_23850 [candidate division CSSED10-310 bacterium]|uniref:Peptidase M16 N-terminal domain-containing protein n=1 Tax=candidate division CSSED10-310 bacterium TaxID=2855610 RepID=A0ABV6Z499_UNCC1